MGKFDMLTVGELSAGLAPKEIIRTEAQEALELQAVTDVGGSYRKAAAQINRYQHRLADNKVGSRQLDYHATRVGEAIFEKRIRDANAVLDQAGIDPKTMLPRKDGVLESTIKLPEPEDNAKKQEKFKKVIEFFNKDLENWAQIKDPDLIFRTELMPGNTVIVCLDEIGVDHQCERRTVKGRKPEGKVKSSARVETTSIHIQKGSNVYRITAPTMKDGIKLALAFLLEHGLKEGVNLIFFFDGARNIRAGLEKYFSFYPYVAYLDWYHLHKKIRELSSSAFSGSFSDKHEIIDGICTRLWAGNIADAFDFIKEQPVRSAKGLKELREYLVNKSPFIYSYALRKGLGYRNASSQVEKTNDLAVAQRQKHKGMTWGYQGSRGLAAITVLRLNGEFDWWVKTGDIRYSYAQAS